MVVRSIPLEHVRNASITVHHDVCPIAENTDGENL